MSNTFFEMIHPGLIMIAAGLLIIALPEKVRPYIQVGGPLIAAISLFFMNDQSSLIYNVSRTISIEFIQFDRLAYIFMLAFVIIAVLNAIYSLGVQKKLEAGMSLVYAGTVMGIILAGDCLSLIIFWELSVIPSTYLIYSRHCRKSGRASFRYLLVHAFGGNFMLVGLIIYIFNKGMTITNISNDSNHLYYWFILIGAAVNAAIPPLNSWVSDAYPESTIGGTLFLASYTTKAAIFVLIRFFAGTEGLIWAGAIMAVYAACMAIMENDVRRLLSYHIVSQLGMMVASLGAGGAFGIDGASAHAFTNIMFKGVLFMGVGAIMYATGYSKITDLGGLAKKMPLTAVCFLISSLAIAGLPGLSGFASKALIMEAIHGFTLPALLVTVAGVGTLLSITLKINYYVFFGKSDIDLQVKPIPVSMKIAMILGTIISVLIGVLPNNFYELLAYQSHAHTFAIGHILEYVAIFIGGSIPFCLYLKKMKPHDEYTLDFDWFYRKPFCKAIVSLSKAVHGFFIFCDSKVLKMAQYMGIHLANPYLWTESSHNAKIKSMSFENEDRQIGSIILTGTSVLIIIMIIAYTII